MPPHPFLLWLGLLASVVLIYAVLLALGSVLYQIVLLIAARTQRRRHRTPRRYKRCMLLPRLFIVVPAHNEAGEIASCLRSLFAQHYPPGRREIVVIADNCSDDTAARAQQLGARVLVREDTRRRGKGYALAWAFEQLLKEDVDGFVVVDADTTAHRFFLRRMAEALFPAHGASSKANSNFSKAAMVAAQGRYSVRNASDGWRAALVAGAFDLTNHVKSLGRDALGASVGLKGNGMGFTRAVVERASSVCASITEDREYGLDLLEGYGVRIRYAPDARVRSAMPTTSGQAASQRERWERGRYRLMRERSLSLLGAGLRRRDPRRIEAALDLLTPPLAELAGLHLALALALCLAAAFQLPILGGVKIWAVIVGLSTAGLSYYVLAGLRLANAPRAAYAALWRAPLYIVWKFILLGASFAGRGTVGGARPGAALEWVRTERP